MPAEPTRRRSAGYRPRSVRSGKRHLTAARPRRGGRHAACASVRLPRRQPRAPRRGDPHLMAHPRADGWSPPPSTRCDGAVASPTRRSVRRGPARPPTRPSSTTASTNGPLATCARPSAGVLITCPCVSWSPRHRAERSPPSRSSVTRTSSIRPPSAPAQPAGRGPAYRYGSRSAASTPAASTRRPEHSTGLFRPNPGPCSTDPP